ncbi:tartrate dehydrogenase [Solibacillus sp. FSL W7-1324]|uniref:tartrate dehydrogenase n=1 Tax=Solibacillus sp. FSL W7-1324 TaxID=2921701 RepID=UPI0030F87733
MKIAVIPGDGIGPEVMEQALRVLETLQELDHALEVETMTFQWNSDYYLQTGRMMPEDGLETLAQYDAILFGAIGDARVPDDVTVWELIMPIRKQFQQYVNFRPVKSLPGIASPLAAKEAIDFVIFRENTEGEYSNSGGRLYGGTEHELAIQNTVMTKAGIDNIVSAACDYALKYKKSAVTSATKSNAVIHTMKFWDAIVNETMSRYPQLQLKSYYIDALVAYFIERPEEFEVVVASNLFGDILSDLGSAIIGGLGLSPSGNINPNRDYPSMFEPVHGSAPDIAGRGIANPIAQIWSLALLLGHTGRPDLEQLIVQAIEQVLAKGEVKTADIGGTATTEEMGGAICNALKSCYEMRGV